MITFLLSVLIGFLGFALYFKGDTQKIKNNVLTMIWVVAAFALLSVTIVNGVVSKQYPFKRVEVERVVVDNLAEVPINDSTVVQCDMYFAKNDTLFFYNEMIKSDIDDFKWLLARVNFTDDTVSYRVETKKVRDVPNSLWVTRWSLLKTDKEVQYYYDSDSLNVAAMELLELFVNNVESKEQVAHVSTEE